MYELERLRYGRPAHRRLEDVRTKIQILEGMSRNRDSQAGCGPSRNPETKIEHRRLRRLETE
jgi:hypothetical protein